MITELSTIKSHLRITSTDEDDMLTQYTEAAEDLIQRYTNRQWDDYYDEFGKVPPAITTAICLLVGQMYQNREATAQQAFNANPVFVAMLRQYKKLS